MCFESPKHSNVREAKNTINYFQDSEPSPDFLVRCSTVDIDEALPSLSRSRSAPPITCIRDGEDYSDDCFTESDDEEVERRFGYFESYYLHRPEGEKWRTPKCPVSSSPKPSPLNITSRPTATRCRFKLIGNTLATMPRESMEVTRTCAPFKEILGNTVSTMSRKSVEVVSTPAQTPRQRETDSSLSVNIPFTPRKKKVEFRSDGSIQTPNSKSHQKAIPSDDRVNLSSQHPYPPTDSHMTCRSDYQQGLTNYQNHPYHGNHYPPTLRNGKFNIPIIRPLAMNFDNYQRPFSNGNFNIPFRQPPSSHLSSINDSRKMLIDDIKRNGDLSLQGLLDGNFLLEIIRCSEGSRMIQQSMDLATLEQKRYAFNLLIPEISSFSIDPFANYVVQKFFDTGDAILRTHITRQLMGHILNLSVNMYGCRVIQKAIDYASPEILSMLVCELKQRGGIKQCIHNQNGNHVIQKLIEKSPDFLIGEILAPVQHRIADLSKHIYGCRVIQKLLKYCQDRKLLAGIIMQISSSIRSLCFNEFGNYVVQFLLQNGAPRDTVNVIRRLHKFILALSTNKYGSNVAEKCFTTGNEAQREAFINIVLDGTNGTAPFFDMVKNEYGNYVIQKMMEGGNSEQVNRIIRSYKSFGLNDEDLRFAKYIKTKIDKIEMDSLGLTPN